MTISTVIHKCTRKSRYYKGNRGRVKITDKLHIYKEENKLSPVRISNAPPYMNLFCRPTRGCRLGPPTRTRRMSIVGVDNHRLRQCRHRPIYFFWTRDKDEYLQQDRENSLLINHGYQFPRDWNSRGQFTHPLTTSSVNKCKDQLYEGPPSILKVILSIPR